MSLPASCDVLVIGAGPAGSSSAALLHQAGYSVAVVEKQKFPRFVIGERLLPRVMDLLGEPGRPQTVRSRFVLDASGYGRVLPRLLDLDQPSRSPPRKAVFAHLSGDRRKAGPDQNRIWIVSLDSGAWAWIIPFSNGTTSFGV